MSGTNPLQLIGAVTSGIGSLGNLWSEFQQMGFDKDKIKAFLGTMIGDKPIGEGGMGGAWGALRGDLGKEFADVERMTQNKFAGDQKSIDDVFRTTKEGNRYLGVARGNELAKFGQEAGKALDVRAGNMGGVFSDARNDVLGRLQGRYDKAMGMLEGAGSGERADIRRDFGAQAGNIAARNAGAGLAGTTIATGSQLANERAKAYSLGNLNDRLINQRVGTHAALSGDIANAASQFGMAGLGMADRLTGERANLETGLAGSRQALSDATNTTNVENQINRVQAKGQSNSDFLTTLIGLKQGYGDMGRQLDTSMLGSTMSGLMGSDIRFPSFAGLDQFGGQLIGMGNSLAAQKAARAEANKKSGLFGMGGGAGATIGMGANLALTPLLGGVPTVMGTMGSGLFGYAADKAFF